MRSGKCPECRQYVKWMYRSRNKPLEVVDKQGYAVVGFYKYNDTHARKVINKGTIRCKEQWNVLCNFYNCNEMMIKPDRTWDLSKEKVFRYHKKFVYHINGRVNEFKCPVCNEKNRGQKNVELIVIQHVKKQLLAWIVL